jgi:hypothetical protein
MALFLTENDVKKLLTATMALEAVESAHRDLALGLAQDTPRARTRLPQTVLHILQGALPAQGVLGYKASLATAAAIVSSFICSTRRPAIYWPSSRPTSWA